MPCYCDEIRIYNREINQLSNTKAKIPAVDNINTEIEQQLRVIAGFCEYAFMASGMDEIKRAINDAAKPFIEIITENEKKISNFTRSIGRDRVDFAEADAYYHAHENDDDD